MAHPQSEPATEVASSADEAKLAPPSEAPPRDTAHEVDAPSPSRQRKRLRFGVFVAVALGLQVGPITTQVLDLNVPLRGWHMFQGQGRDICDVRFTEHTADGRELPRTVEHVVQTAGALGTGRQMYRLNDVKEIRALAAGYCARSRGSELRAIARCGDRDKGWRKVLKGSEDLCRPRE